MQEARHFIQNIGSGRSMESYKTLKKYASFEYEDRKSVFIGEVKPVCTEAEALAFVESVRKKYPDARHHVYAYVLRENSISRFTDDHEPQGTAGMPMLDVIRKKAIVDVVAVVTRYFGGTLLGTGGLVRAYTSATVGAIESAGIAVFDIYSELSVTVSYADYGKLSPRLDSMQFTVADIDYSDNVTLIGKLPKSNFEAFSAEVTEITSARAEIEYIGDGYDSV